jgi:hypothetical protein
MDKNDDANELIFTAGEGGEDTEDLIGQITKELEEKKLLDQVKIGRELIQSDDLGSEPFTIAAIVICSTAVTIEVGRIVERWQEKRRQREQIKLTIEAFTVSEEAGKAVAKLAEKHADTDLQKLPQHPDYTKFDLLGQSSGN